MKSIVAALRGLQLPFGAQPGQPRLVLGPDIPAPLVAFYSGNSVYACELAYADATHMHYTVWLFITATGETARAQGWLLGTSVYESFLEYIDPAATANPGRQLFFGDAFASIPNGTQYNFSGASGGILDPSSGTYSALELDSVNPVDLVIDGISQPRGLLMAVAGGPSLSSTAAGTGVGTESGVFSNWTQGTGNSFTLKARRWAQLTMSSAVSNNGGWTALIVRCKSTLSGAILAQHEITVPDNGHLDVLQNAPFYIYNNTAADITTGVEITIQRRACQTGGAVVSIDGSAITVEDKGSVFQFVTMMGTQVS